MKKKIFAAVLATAMLVGCSNSNTQSSNNSEPAEGEVVELEFWLSGSDEPVQVLVDKVEEWNQSQDQYHVSITRKASYKETYETLQAAIAGKVAPDVALLDVAPARSLFTKGVLVSLDDFQANDPDYNASDFFEVYMDQAIYEGSTFARPMYGTIQIGYASKKAWADAGVDPKDVTDWQALIEAAQKIKDAGYEYGWEPMGGDAKNLIDAAFANGAKVFSDDGKTVTINTPEWVEVWEFFRKAIHDDHLMITHQGGQGWQYWYDTIDDVTGGKAGGYTGSPADAVDTPFDWDEIEPIEQPGWNGKPSMPMAQALVLAIPTGGSTAKQQGAYELIKFLTSPEVQAPYAMAAGYPVANRKAAETEEFIEFAKQNPLAGILASQSEHASVYPVDPTGGAVLDALNLAAEKLEVDNVPAQEVLDEAQQIAQVALDDALAQ